MHQRSDSASGVKALTTDQLALFLETARVKAPCCHPLFLLTARAGLRVGQAVALGWPEVDPVGRQIRVAHTPLTFYVLRS